MKRTKRFASIATAALLAACAVVPSMASIPASAVEPTATITFKQADTNDTATHNYVAYQIFKGDSVTTDGELTNVQWAITNEQASALIAALKALNVSVPGSTDSTTIDPFESLNAGDSTNNYATMSTAPAVAKALALVPTLEVKGENSDPSTYTPNATAAASKVADAIAKLATAESGWTSAASTTEGATTLNISSTGYYIFVESLTNGQLTVDADKQGAVSKHILRTINVTDGDTDNVTITVKSGLPSVIKKVQENVKETTGYGEDATLSALQSAVDNSAGWNDVADYNIGDAVPFELIGSLPERYADYEHYYYCFNDTLDAGFVKPEVSNIKVWVVNSGSDPVDVTSKLSEDDIAVTGENSSTEASIKVEIKDLTTLKDDENKALVNANSLIKVTYSAKLDTDAVIGLDGNENGVTLTYSNNPNSTGDGTAKPNDTGETPEDKVIVFTYELDNTKVDSDNKPVADAKFVLYRGSDSNIEYAVLDDDMKVTDWLKGTLEVATDGTISFTKSASANNTEATTPTVLTSGTDGKFNVKGLDDGTYYVKEIKAPEGFNALKGAVTMKIQATTANDQKWDTFEANKALAKLELTVTPTEGDSAAVDTSAPSYKTTDESTKAGEFAVSAGEKADGDNKITYTGGIVAAKIVNTSGAILPSTGGIGTTIFYTVGGVLVVGAGVLLITKKRAKNAE